MFAWLANLLQTEKIRELEREKGEAELWGEALELTLKDTERQRDSFKQGFDSRGEELIVKQETLRITNEELGQLRAELGNRKAYVEQLEGEAEEGRKAFHELAGLHDSLREVEGQAQEALTKANFELATKEQQLGELAAARDRERRNCDYWSSAYWGLRRHEDLWQALYDIKHQQLMDTVDAYREYRRGIFQLGRVGQADKARVDRQIARLEETVKRKDARIASLELELKNAMRRDPKTGRIISRGKR